MPVNAIAGGAQYALAVTNAVKQLTVPAGGANYCLVSCEIAQVRWTDDGTDPTTANGFLLNPGGELRYDGQPEDLKFIRTGATSASLMVSYYQAS